MKSYFITFSDSRWLPSAERIYREAQDMGSFDHILIANEYDLDPVFVERFKNKLTTHVHGFGNFIWKPQIIKQAFDIMEYGDVLVYCDMGCILNRFGKDKLAQYFQEVKNSEIGMLFGGGWRDLDGEGPLYSVTRYCKGDVIDHFDLRAKIAAYDYQMYSTPFFYEKRESTVKFVNEWIDIFWDDYDLIDHSVFHGPNFSNFTFHCEDQALFTVLCISKDIEPNLRVGNFYPEKMLEMDRLLNNGYWNDRSSESNSIRLDILRWLQLDSPEPILFARIRLSDASKIPFHSTNWHDIRGSILFGSERFNFKAR